MHFYALHKSHPNPAQGSRRVEQLIGRIPPRFFNPAGGVIYEGLE